MSKGPDRNRRWQPGGRGAVVPAGKDIFYRNRGDNTFADETDETLRKQEPRYAFTPVVGDFDRDGDLDVYVTNDGDRNTFWMNDNTGHFDDHGPEAALDVNSQGAQQASTGSDSADYDQDGWPDLFTTSFANDTNTLLRNLTGEVGALFFEERTREAGLARGDFPKVCFGAKFQDFDQDGGLDLFVAAGHVFPEIRNHEANHLYCLVEGGALQRVR